jgi:hypothetical protein
MHLPLSPSLIAAALVTLGGFAVAVDGCASKSPPPDPTPNSTTPAPKQPESTAADASTSVGAGTSASAGAAPCTDAITGGGPLTSARASAGGGSSAAAATSTGAPSNGAVTSAGGGASADSASGSAIPVDRAQTSDERRAALDKRLKDSLGAFDVQLRKEQERIARERDARQAAVTTVAAVDGGAQPAPNESGDAPENTAEPSHKTSASHRSATDSRSARGGDLKSDKSAGGANGNASGNGAVAEEIPDGNDDDVVARRLRKAAEQETDPELKDKLWKEYVEYKKNTQGK